MQRFTTRTIRTALFGTAMALSIQIASAQEDIEAEVASEMGIESALEKGTLAGTVRDTISSAILKGAVISVPGTSYRAVTDDKGSFRLTGLPAGEHPFQVEYLGYVDKTISIQVQPGQVVRQDVQLKDSYLSLSPMVVKSQRRGQAQALNQQLNADNIQVVISSDNIGRLPDQNASEALQRVPGVSVARDQGEGRYVMVRGTHHRLTSVKLHGQDVPAPEGEIRSVALDVVASDQLGGIELHKSLTPDMDADAIGGTVNMKLHYAEDTLPSFSLSAAGGYNNELASPENFTGTARYSQRYQGGLMGLSLAATYTSVHRGSDNNEMAWRDIGTPDLALEEMDLRDYEVRRHRVGLSANYDVRPWAGHEFNLFTTYNRFADNENRRRLILNFEDGEAERELKDRFEAQNLFMLQAGGKHDLSMANVDYSASYSYADEEEPGAQYVVFKRDVELPEISSASDFPSVPQLRAGNDLLNSSTFAFDELSQEDNLTRDQNLIGALNVGIPVSPEWNFKLGTKYRYKYKTRDNQALVYGLRDDAADITMDAIDGSYHDDDFLSGEYDIGRSPDPEKSARFGSRFGSSLELDEGASFADSRLGDYNAEEHVIGTYLQTRYEIGDWMLLGGARNEFTMNESYGWQIDLDNQTESKVKSESDVNHILPMFHVRYRLTPKTNVRLAATQSIARPDPYLLVPFRLQEDDEVELGNPDLGITKASNVDFMVSHYFKSLGIVSAGAFYKWIEDLHYEGVFEQDGLEFSQWRNGDWGEVRGLELAYNQQFTFLPGAWSGLGLFANYTYSWSEALVPDRGVMDLPGQSDHMGNVALSFEKWGFQGRLAMNMHGSYLDEVGTEEADDSYYDNHMQWDISLSQQVYRGLRLFTEVNNLTDEPLRFYSAGRSSLPKQQEFYSTWGFVGLKYVF